jgi:competence ComEA-like helix-hairpin-helix protein
MGIFGFPSFFLPDVLHTTTCPMPLQYQRTIIFIVFVGFAILAWSFYQSAPKNLPQQSISPEILDQIRDHPLLFNQPLNINSATADELQGITKVGPVLAKRIVAHRKEHGPFKNLDELRRVKGIGPAMMVILKKHCHVDDPH